MKRVQRSRKKGYKTPPNTKYVGRGSKWGNPFKVNDNCSLEKSIKLYEQYLKESDLNPLDLIEFDNLSCWCSLDSKCHADVLINAIK